MYVASFSSIANDAAFHSLSGSRKMMMNRSGGEQHWDGGVIMIDSPVSENDQAH
jgi:hypothetical protein